MNPVARTNDVYIQPLSNEVVVYDRTSHQAHCLSMTTFKVWENADGTRSIDQMAELLNKDLNLACGRDVVLLALEDLRKANLLQTATLPEQAPLPSRRDVARKLSVAGLSASLLPFIGSMVAPTPAMARSGNYTASNYRQEYAQAMADAGKNLKKLYQNKNGSLNDLETAIADGNAGLVASGRGRQSAAQTDFKNAETEFNDMLKALGLPPL